MTSSCAELGKHADKFNKRRFKTKGCQDKDKALMPLGKPITPHTYTRIIRAKKRVANKRSQDDDSARLRRIEMELKKLRDEQYEFSKNSRLMWEMWAEKNGTDKNSPLL
ncbi:hypothetical protein H6P81_019851 [Aristolochia fimbriata]|uniref:Uncharacterized protein n=1 Tax=Aristolochia fimbriata TaxID=158543 RepID=A0AAV7DU47_ARIFI|nr:hypothetical protein H6P81_019851 [Aristolochia fimbriata]